MAKQFVLGAGLSVIALTVALSSVVLAQGGRGGGFRGPGGFGGGGPFGGGTLNLVMRPEVQDELQLVDEQREKVMAAAEDMRQRLGEELRDMFSQMGNLSDQERQERFEEILAAGVETLNKELESRLKKELLPHQFDRLKQIDVQTRIQQRGADALTSGELAEALGLTEEQREKLEARAAEVQQELQEKIAQLRIEARQKMLDVLNPEQRAKLESLMGDAFALPDGGFGPGGFQGRGRGGNAGGNRGRR